jgi:hypothetical protein
MPENSNNIGIRTAIEQRNKDTESFPGSSRLTALRPSPTETGKQLGEQVEMPPEPLNIKEEVKRRDQQVEEAQEISKESSRQDIRRETATIWQGAWVVVFTFFLAITLTLTGLSLLFGGPSPFETYLFLGVILVLLLIIYPIAQFVERRANRR